MKDISVVFKHVKRNFITGTWWSCFFREKEVKFTFIHVHKFESILPWYGFYCCTCINIIILTNLNCSIVSFWNSSILIVKESNFHSYCSIWIFQIFSELIMIDNYLLYTLSFSWIDRPLYVWSVRLYTADKFMLLFYVLSHSLTTDQ